ncbi:MAG TPA: SOS response-associated peptidase [Acidimicrobiales bacterium]|nr:SOS response-associated peptidase [Acidimicrobiales bacterium]
MCGRYVLVTPPPVLASRFGARLAPGVEERFVPSYNVAPTRTVLGVAAGADGERVLDAYRWGLVPSWARDASIGTRLFNARAETLARKPAFRAAFARRRLAVVADGFYEWRREPAGRRQPFFLSRPDGAPLAFAGLWESWRDPGRPDDPGASVRSCTIVTTAANEDVAPVHDRMPALLEAGALDAWLDPLADLEELEALLRSPRGGTLVRRPVDRRVGDVRNDSPALLAEREAASDPRVAERRRPAPRRAGRSGAAQGPAG